MRFTFVFLILLVFIFSCSVDDDSSDDEGIDDPGTTLPDIWPVRLYIEDGSYFKSMHKTSDNCIIISGFIHAGINNTDIACIKLGADGRIIWQKGYGGLKSDVPYSTVKTSDNGFIMLGITYSFESVNKDYLVIKFDAEGNIQWDRAIGNTDAVRNHDYVNSIVQLSDNNYVLAGSSARGSSAWGPIYFTKLDTSGNIVWQKDLGDMSMNYYVEDPLLATSDGGFIIGGKLRGTGGSDVWIVKFNTNGEIVWQKKYVGSGIDNACTIQSTGDGGYIFTGKSNSFNEGTDQSNHIWVLKLDSTGSIIWQKLLATEDSEEVEAMIVTSDNKYLLTGITSTGNGQHYLWSVLLDSNGSIVWQKKYGDCAKNSDYRILEISEGIFIAAGTYDDPDFLEDSIFAVKIDNQGLSGDYCTDAEFLIKDTNIQPETTNYSTRDTTLSVRNVECSEYITDFSIIEVDF